MDPKEHYDDQYFAWQSSGAVIGARINAEKFRSFLPPGGVVLDFGCGGGYLLNELRPTRGLGIEINPVAIEQARNIGIEVYDSLSEVADESIDLVISNHALEHVSHPFDVMCSLYRVLKPGSRAVIVVPCDDVSYAFREDDKDFHLYSWSAGNLGNLAKASGFSVDEVSEYAHKWPKSWQKIYRRYGAQVFHILARLYAKFDRDRNQVRLVATKAIR